MTAAPGPCCSSRAAERHSAQPTLQLERNDGRIRQQLLGAERCVAVPTRPPPEVMDLHSVVADPLLLDPEAGNFSILPGSPALGLGFQTHPTH